MLCAASYHHQPTNRSKSPSIPGLLLLLLLILLWDEQTGRKMDGSTLTLAQGKTVRFGGGICGNRKRHRPKEGLEPGRPLRAPLFVSAFGITLGTYVWCLHMYICMSNQAAPCSVGPGISSTSPSSIRNVKLCVLSCTILCTMAEHSTISTRKTYGAHIEPERDACS